MDAQLEHKRTLTEEYPCWEDEIDLRSLVETLLRWAWLILAVTVVSAVFAFGFASFTKPVQYEASSTAFVTTDRAARILSGVAMSGDVLQKLYGSVSGMFPELQDYEGLKKYVKVSALSGGTRGGKSVGVKFTARASDPGKASKLVNEWVSLSVFRANEALKKDKVQDLSAVRRMYSEASDDLRQKENALAELEKEDKVAILSNKLSSLKSLQSQYLAKERGIRLLIRDVSTTKSRLEQRKGGSPSLSDDLAILSLSLRSVGGSGNVQLQVSQASSLFSTNSMQERVSYLNGMEKELSGELAKLQEGADALDTEILGTQYQLQIAKNKLSDATRERDIALRKYNDLSAKLRAAEVAVEIPKERAEIGVPAVRPTKPVPRRRLMSAVLAAVVGFMLAVFAVFAIEWWKGESQPGSGAP